MRVAVFNVKYSPNLGDGVIAECLEQALRERAGFTVCSIDLAGREGFGPVGDGRGRALKLAVLRRMPGPLRDGVTGLVLGLKVWARLMPRWRALLRGADVAVFGGGQLIQDTDLNFPIKLAGAVALCRKLRIPMAVFAVGAARCRSPLGRALLGKLLRSRALFHATARDAASVQVLRELGCEAEVCGDPGILAAKVWPAPPRAKRARPTIGLGITHGAVLAHHASARSVPAEDALALYVLMAERLSVQGNDVVLFTNGAAEDELLLGEVASRVGQLQAGAGTVRVAPRSSTPGALARLIASFDCVVAHRLHAAILAYSYRVPGVGLRWDDKLVHFYQWVGRGDFVSPFDRSTAEDIAGIVDAAMQRPIDDAAHQRAIGDTVAGIDRLIAAIASEAGVPRAAGPKQTADKADAKLALADGGAP